MKAYPKNDPRIATLAQMFDEAGDDAPDERLRLMAMSMFAYGATCVLLMTRRGDGDAEIDRQIEAMIAVSERETQILREAYAKREVDELINAARKL